MPKFHVLTEDEFLVLYNAKFFRPFIKETIITKKIENTAKEITIYFYGHEAFDSLHVMFGLSGCSERLLPKHILTGFIRKDIINLKNLIREIIKDEFDIQIDEYFVYYYPKTTIESHNYNRTSLFFSKNKLSLNTEIDLEKNTNNYYFIK